MTGKEDDHGKEEELKIPIALRIVKKERRRDGARRSLEEERTTRHRFTAKEEGRGGERTVAPDEELYKFQRLEVYQLALDYVDRIYALTHLFPESERFNLRSQFERAGTSIVLNIAEGSTGQSDAEQSRFLGLALRSYIETVACMDLIERRGILMSDQVSSLRVLGHQVFVKIQAMRRALGKR